MCDGPSRRDRSQPAELHALPLARTKAKRKRPTIGKPQTFIQKLFAPLSQPILLCFNRLTLFRFPSQFRGSVSLSSPSFSAAGFA